MVARHQLAGPPGFPQEKYLALLNHPGMNSSEWRREVCRTEPALFACVYMARHLTSPETNGLVSLSEFHVEAAYAARQWMRTDLGPAESRTGWLAARGSGKSTWFNLILLIWAMAYKHRDFIVVFGHTGSMARRHLLSLRSELTKNELLRADFPELVAPAVSGRRSVMDTQDGYMASSGAAVIVAGLDQGTLGIKLENRRPSLLVIDDGEPPDSNYSDHQKSQRLATLREAVMPMSLNAVLCLVGTTTRMGSIMDDVRRQVDWVRDENISVRHFPALITDEMTGQERSAWPERWPLEYLQSVRHTRSFQVNYQCEPMAADGTHWRPEDFHYDDGRLVGKVTVKTLAIDPAMTSSKRADESGLAIVGYADGRCLVERAVGVRMDPKALRELVHRTLRADPTIRTVLAEVSNGGDWITQALEPLPGAVQIVTLRPTLSKLSRLTELYDHYQRGRIWHAAPMPTLERQLCAFPHAANDDIGDAVDAAVRWLFSKFDAKEAA